MTETLKLSGRGADAHGDWFKRNMWAHLRNCDNCTDGGSQMLMCDHHAEERGRSSACCGCGLRVFWEGNTIPHETLCDDCKADLPRAYRDWKGYEAGKRLAQDVLDILRGARPEGWEVLLQDAVKASGLVK